MVKVLEIGDHFILVHGRVSIGFICLDHICYMIDSGLDSDQARHALKIIDEKNFSLVALLNTHSHADHIGGNNFVARRKNIPIYSSELETAYINHPILEPIMLYGGFPPKELRTKFFMATPSHARSIEENKFPFKIVSLKGHSPNMIGFLIDEIFFTADAYIDKNILEKHIIPYNYDPQAALKTLENLLDTKGYIYVPSHGKPSNNPGENILSNIKAIEKVRFTIETIISKELTTEIIITKTLSKLGVKIANIGLYHLYRSALIGYLTWLEKDDLINSYVNRNKLMWRPIKK